MWCTLNELTHIAPNINDQHLYQNKHPQFNNVRQKNVDVNPCVSAFGTGRIDFFILNNYSDFNHDICLLSNICIYSACM